MSEKHTCSQALENLRKGNAKHIERMKSQGDRAPYTTGVTEPGQTPYAAILGCADSRVIPEDIFEAHAGQLFTVRVAGNIANTSSIASLEYAIAVLNVPLIVVMGHESCGAVGAALDQAQNRKNYGANLNDLLSHIVPAINEPTVDDLPRAVRRNAELTAQALITKSEILRDHYERKTFSVVHGYYQIYGENAGKVDGIDTWNCQ